MNPRQIRPYKLLCVAALLAQLALGNLSTLSAQSVSFIAPRRDFAAGRGPFSVAVGDFNGDGKLDLAVANLGSDNISVLLGNGDGTFGPAANFAAGRGPHSVAVGDFNGDGKLDLAVANAGDFLDFAGTVSVLLGNGDGTFRPAVNFAAGSGSVSVAVGDFNGDGKLDLAVANVGSETDPGTVSVLLGNGDGTFGPRVNFPAGFAPDSVAVGDFNGDGKLDLAVADGSSDNVFVLLGNGDGSFAPRVSFGAGHLPESVAVGDFNGDGKLDLAVANGGGFPAVGTVSVLLGNGDGTFAPAVNFPAGFAPDSVAVGDFNGDGKLDLAVANAGGLARGFARELSGLSVLLGNGDGSFGPAVNFSAGNNPVSVAAGDFNSDGRLDLAVAGAGDFPSLAAGAVSVLLGNGDGSFGSATNFEAGSTPFSLAVGDFNGDGKLDLAVANRFSDNVSVLLGNGDGSFGSAVNFGAGRLPESVAVGDFNGDGKLDLVVANFDSGTVSVLLGNGDGTFGPAVNFAAGAGPTFVAVGDFNGDGKLDLAVANDLSSDISVLLGNGDGTFAPAVNFAAGVGPTSVAVGDFNGDGKLDLAVANRSSNNVSVLLGNGDGTFGPAMNFAAGAGPTSVAVGDFNGDGKLDLAVANVGVFPDFAGTVSVLLGNGDGSFAPAVTFFASGFSPQSVVVGDFNGDGKLDLAVANSGSNNVSVLLGNGDGTLAPAVTFAAGVGPASVAVGDFNGDGQLDLAVANSGSNNVTVLVNNTRVGSTPPNTRR